MTIYNFYSREFHLVEKGQSLNWGEKRRDEHEERMRSIENEERMRSFPYNSNEEEYEQLYLDSIQESLDNDRDHRRQSNGRYY